MELCVVAGVTLGTHLGRNLHHWIQSMQRAKKERQAIIAQLEDFERRIAHDRDLQETFRAARASTGLPQSNVLPQTVSLRTRCATEELETREGDGGKINIEVPPLEDSESMAEILGHVQMMRRRRWAETHICRAEPDDAPYLQVASSVYYTPAGSVSLVEVDEMHSIVHVPLSQSPGEVSRAENLDK
ncbi:hypothetical protein CALVIDRAFT_599689 [Calocera viscosa TUFC12733]|uniref:Uncharacterized protein n=1 Tax=Calocera viscosa (strain TUFC12733) TaxID=1330018 RepID=A0A167KG36_CALVF|nr:hypothetical protein CALVIDRAFT_599689 [Calocera viscosa TUFC12733]